MQYVLWDPTSKIIRWDSKVGFNENKSFSACACWLQWSALGSKFRLWVSVNATGSLVLHFLGKFASVLHFKYFCTLQRASFFRVWATPSVRDYNVRFSLIEEPPRILYDSLHHYVTFWIGACYLKLPKYAKPKISLY